MAYLNEPPVAQGEIEFFAVTDDHFDGAELTAAEMVNDYFIVAHSESGHHHVMDRDDADVSVVSNPESPGMTVLRILVKNPTQVVNLNPTGHEKLDLTPRMYAGHISREMGMDDVIRRSQD